MGQIGFKGSTTSTCADWRKCEEFAAKFRDVSEAQDLQEQLEMILKSHTSGILIVFWFSL